MVDPDSKSTSRLGVALLARACATSRVHEDQVSKVGALLWLVFAETHHCLDFRSRIDVERTMDLLFAMGCETLTRRFCSCTSFQNRERLVHYARQAIDYVSEFAPPSRRFEVGRLDTPPSDKDALRLDAVRIAAQDCLLEELSKTQSRAQRLANALEEIVRHGHDFHADHSLPDFAEWSSSYPPPSRPLSSLSALSKRHPSRATRARRVSREARVDPS